MTLWLPPGATAGPWALPAAHTSGPGLPRGMVTLPLPGQLLPKPDNSFRKEIPPDVYPKCLDRELCWPRRPQSFRLADPHECSLGSPLTASSRQRRDPCWLYQVLDEALSHQYRQGEVPQYTKCFFAQLYHQLSGVRGGFQVLDTNICLLLTMACCFSAIIE